MDVPHPSLVLMSSPPKLFNLPPKHLFFQMHCFCSIMRLIQFIPSPSLPSPWQSLNPGLPTKFPCSHCLQSTCAGAELWLPPSAFLFNTCQGLIMFRTELWSLAWRPGPLLSHFFSKTMYLFPPQPKLYYWYYFLYLDVLPYFHHLNNSPQKERVVCLFPPYYKGNTF